MGGFGQAAPFHWATPVPGTAWNGCEELQLNFWHHMRRERPLKAKPNDESVKAQFGRRRGSAARSSPGRRALSRQLGLSRLEPPLDTHRAWTDCRVLRRQQGHTQHTGNVATPAGRLQPSKGPTEAHIGGNTKNLKGQAGPGCTSRGCLNGGTRGPRLLTTGHLL